MIDLNTKFAKNILNAFISIKGWPKRDFPEISLKFKHDQFVFLFHILPIGIY